MTAIDKLKEVAAFLKNAGIENAAKEAELLITEALLKKPQMNIQSTKTSQKTKEKGERNIGNL